MPTNWSHFFIFDYIYGLVSPIPDPNLYFSALNISDTKCVGFFSYSITSSRILQTPTDHPITDFSPGTDYPELSADSHRLSTQSHKTLSV